MTTAATVTVQTNASGAIAAITARLEKGLAFAGLKLADRIKQRLAISNQGGIFPAEAGDSPHRGSGEMIRAVFHAKAGHLTHEVGFKGLAYAHLQEYGGIIRIKSKEWLTVPVSREALKHKTANRSARDFPRKLIFLPTRRADLAYLVERHGGGRQTIHYVMRKSVYIPAHPTLRPAARDPEWQRIAMAGFKGEATGIEVAE